MKNEVDFVSELESLRTRVVTLQAACDSSQKAHRKALQCLRSFVEYAPEAIVLIDLETGRYTDTNPMAVQLFGYPLETLLAVGPFALSPESQPDGCSVQRSRPAAGFTRLDKNKNGFIEADELGELHQRRLDDPKSMKQRLESGDVPKPPQGNRPEGLGDTEQTGDRQEIWNVNPVAFGKISGNSTRERGDSGSSPE